MADKIAQEIVDFDKYPELQKTGENKGNKVEIFTPFFIVQDMVKCIGDKYVSDITHTILEPSSGDGAFTVYILELRLKGIWKNDKTHYLQKSLQALSTIYSIEMNEPLIKKQRSNIYSLLCYFAKTHKIILTEEYLKLAKEIIATNFMWAETNIKSKPNLSLYDIEIAWYMPESNKKTNNAVKFAKWNIDEDLNYTVNFEEAEIGE
ncbi:MAG: hypothetical protein LBT20_07020 [Clostridiales bacterium]|jgi:hypothetical protein|nr:hypothetical protein [Clostridiales bacterium]